METGPFRLSAAARMLSKRSVSTSRYRRIESRRQMVIRTIFNMLGPLTNPAGANTQVVGVYAAHLTDLLAEVLAQLGSTRALVVHGTDGLDEITITAESKITEVRNGE